MTVQPWRQILHHNDCRNNCFVFFVFLHTQRKAVTHVACKLIAIIIILSCEWKRTGTVGLDLSKRWDEVIHYDLLRSR